MAKKKREEQLQFINDLIKDKKEYTEKQKHLMEYFLFNIICSNSVLNRYEFSTFRDLSTEESVDIYDCINWLGNKIKEKGENDESN